MSEHMLLEHQCVDRKASKLNRWKRMSTAGGAWMKIQLSRSALVLSALVIAALVISISTAVYAQDGNKVNMGEADSHLKVNSSKKSWTPKNGAAEIDEAAGKQPSGQVTDEVPERQLPHHKNRAPAGQNDMPGDRQKQPVKD